MTTFIIVDFEATCCRNEEFPREEREIIEIGACALNEAHQTVGEFQILVQPQRHPLLTPFCTKLTSITQEQVDTAVKFPQALERFRQWIYSFTNPVFYSWGSYDREQLVLDCEYYQLTYPFSEEHINVKHLFRKQILSRRDMGLSKALDKMGIPFEGKPHRAINDARNTAKLLSILQKESHEATLK